jgi:hypothetical protein
VDVSRESSEEEEDIVADDEGDATQVSSGIKL